MTPKINNLLSVLDMTEEKQNIWVWKNILGYSDKAVNRVFLGIYKPESLADLAFRMRDEADLDITYSLTLIWDYKKINKDFVHWIINDSQAIDWIIASLIAKELAKM